MAGYRIVPGGVSRGRTALKKPSTRALILEGRNGASRSAFRRGAVPSDVRKGYIEYVVKAATLRSQEVAQLDRKRKLTRIQTTSAGLGGVATLSGALSAIPKVKNHRHLKHTGKVAIGAGTAAGVLGTYGALRGAKVVSTDLEIQRRKLGVAKGDRRRATAVEGAASGAALGSSAALIRRGTKGALVGAAVGGAAGAATHKDPVETRRGKLTLRTSSSVSPMTVTRRKGIPVPVPGRHLETNAYRGKKHVGYVDSQQSALRPRDNHLVNAYVPASHRGKGIAPEMVRHNTAYAGRTASASGHRSKYGDKLAGKMGHRSAGSHDHKSIVANLDEAWPDRRQDRVRKGLPGMESLHVPRGLLKAKTYRASGIRTTKTGRLVRTKANVG